MATLGHEKARQLCHVNLLKSYYRHVIDSNLDQDVKDHVHPVLTVSPEGVAQKGYGVPEPDYGLLCGC